MNVVIVQPALVMETALQLGYIDVCAAMGSMMK